MKGARHPKRPCHIRVPVQINPMLVGRRQLIDEPLDVEDWRVIHQAYRAFMFTVRETVNVARARACGCRNQGANHDDRPTNRTNHH